MDATAPDDQNAPRPVFTASRRPRAKAAALSIVAAVVVVCGILTLLGRDADEADKRALVAMNSDQLLGYGPMYPMEQVVSRRNVRLPFGLRDSGHVTKTVTQGRQSAGVSFEGAVQLAVAAGWQLDTPLVAAPGAQPRNVRGHRRVPLTDRALTLQISVGPAKDRAPAEELSQVRIEIKTPPNR